MNDSLIPSAIPKTSKGEYKYDTHYASKVDTESDLHTGFIAFCMQKVCYDALKLPHQH